MLLKGHYFIGSGTIDKQVLEGLMPFQIIRNDITKVKADAIVNTANPEPIIGSGTDSAIYKAAGENELLAERKKIGVIKRGDIAVSPAFGLKAKYIMGRRR